MVLPFYGRRWLRRLLFCQFGIFIGDISLKLQTSESGRSIGKLWMTMVAKYSTLRGIVVAGAGEARNLGIMASNEGSSLRQVLGR